MNMCFPKLVTDKENKYGTDKQNVRDAEFVTDNQFGKSENSNKNVKEIDNSGTERRHHSTLTMSVQGERDNQNAYWPGDGHGEEKTGQETDNRK